MRYLKDSLELSVLYIRKFIKRKMADFTAEAIYQLAKDSFYYQFGEHPKMNIYEALHKMRCGLTESELELMLTIETSSRKKDDYMEMIENMDLISCESILNKIDKTVIHV